jgi:hypothetical protein
VSFDAIISDENFFEIFTIRMVDLASNLIWHYFLTKWHLFSRQFRQSVGYVYGCSFVVQSLLEPEMG